MLKRKSDDELEILEKLVKKKQFGLIFILVALSVLIKQITTEKQRKPILLKYKTAEENWIEESLAAFNARIWL